MNHNGHKDHEEDPVSRWRRDLALSWWHFPVV